MQRRLRRTSLYKIKSWPEDARCLQNTQIYTALEKTHALNAPRNTCRPVGDRLNVKRISKGLYKRVREEKPEGPETPREKPSKSLCWIIDPLSLSLPIYKSIHYAYRYLSKCMKYLRGLWIDDIWITHNISSAGRDNSHRKMHNDISFKKRYLEYELLVHSRMRNNRKNIVCVCVRLHLQRKMFHRAEWGTPHTGCMHYASMPNTLVSHLEIWC